jgi:ADP-heptose:LPS heptosyltransferase
MSEQIERIAIFRALHLGDMLLAVPALRSIRASFPNAEITLIGLPWATSFTSRFSHYIDRFVQFVGYPGIAEVEVDAKCTQQFLDEQRAYGYDLVIQMHGSGRTSNSFILALKGRMTAGYYDGSSRKYSRDDPCGRPMAGLTSGMAGLTSDIPQLTSDIPRSTSDIPQLTFSMPYPDNWPEVLRNLGLAQLLGCDNISPTLEFPLFKEDHIEATKLLRKLPRAHRPWIGMHVGSRSPARRWSSSYFAQVADYFASHHNAQIILTGSRDDSSTVQEVTTRMAVQPLCLAGETSLGGLAALISKLDLFISNDTGPAHIANAVDTRSLTIFGPVDPQRWAALNQVRHPIVRKPVACSPCGYWECPIDHRCLQWLRPEMVIEAAEKLLLRGEVVCNA